MAMPMDERIRVDGQASSAVPVGDRGLAYGDGVFRTVRIDSGRALGWWAHWQRLQHDCAALGLGTPVEDEILVDMQALFGDAEDGVCKIMVTRGSGGRGYMPPQPAQVRRIVSGHELPAHARGEPAPLALERSSIELAIQPRLAGIKHLNRLEQVLARGECSARGQADAWMADANGFVIATTMRNLFFSNADGDWYTPRLTRAGIIGATRQRLWCALEQAGMRVSERDIRPPDLGRCRAGIACNSVGGVVAISHFDGRELGESESAAAYARGLLNDMDTRANERRERNDKAGSSD